jgi:diaminohydroxyphosphoribosylaminopyrimidine deaminase/5-amino-6-(5-phosphoribosylamino)uracil reductase
MNISLFYPSVGAIIVKDDQILGVGHTKPAGQDHAEITAIKSTLKPIKNATLYVTLEPCCHFGRTPPCVNAIINANIRRVVYGVLDPNPLVSGKGILNLKTQGLLVEPINNQELIKLSLALLKPFHSRLKKKRPYTIVKVATSADNKIALLPLKRTFITGPQANIITHNLRHVVDAIMVGTNTAHFDNPYLTVRLDKNNRQPTRIVLDQNGRLLPTLNIFNTKEAKTILVISQSTSDNYAARYHEMGVSTVVGKTHKNLFDLKSLLETLGDLGLNSLLIEPGKKLFASLLNDGLADEIWWFTSPSCIENGLLLGFTQEDLVNQRFKKIYHDTYGSDHLRIFASTPLELFQNQ